MINYKTKEGTPVNLIQVALIEVEGSDLVFRGAKNTGDVREHFDTPEEAENKLQDLKGYIGV